VVGRGEMGKNEKRFDWGSRKKFFFLSGVQQEERSTKGQISTNEYLSNAKGNGVLLRGKRERGG